ncbi:MAG: sulfatase [Vicinamibacteria bacterium]|nr:sulfatase [Vicinamibacteria bacterium]
MDQKTKGFLSNKTSKGGALDSFRRMVAIGGAFSVLTVLGCSRRPSPPNLVLVVVDSLRADALGCYGAERSASPNIDRIAAEGLRYERVVAQAPWNVPSISSLITSSYPHEHGQGVSAGAAADVTTLAEALAKRGYTTAAFIEAKSWPLLERGFGRIEKTASPSLLGDPQNNLAVRTVEAAQSWIPEPGQGPFFVLIHTYETYSYFMGKPAHRAFAKRERPEYSGRFFDWGIRDEDAAFGPRVIEALLDASAEDAAFVKSVYRGAISETDAAVGRLDAFLKKKKLDGDTVLVVTSSHGEGFRPDLKRVHHGGRLHDDLLRVPLVIRWPGRIEPRVERSIVAAIDVAPTLLALAGGDQEGFRGRALLTLPESAWPFFGKRRFKAVDQPSRSIMTEESAMRVLPSGERESASVRQIAVYSEGVKLIDNGETVELYDLKIDPSEERNVAADHQDAVAALCSQIESFRQDSVRTPSTSDERVVDMLESLGYLSKDPQAPAAASEAGAPSGCERALTKR